MTIEQLSQWMHEPHTLNQEQVAELRKLCEEFPYFAVCRMLLLKGLRNTNDVLFESEIRKTAIYCPDRRKLYFLLYPVTDTQTQSGNLSKASYNDVPGDYFSLQEVNEPADKSQSLKNLAQKLKEARQQKAATATTIRTTTPSPEIEEEPTKPVEEELIFTEDEAIRLIRAKDFEKALKILRVLHLNIPEKSVYFADQIRYLEKIIATINKS
ncbi:hypothetical protein [Paludibacter sp.]|uniref:hypothetical protein n=1 Tax=Paludibacter sp. TaxID=1898105 RepID=UPI001354D109|nr:hypothetical protein [Paludibacter sp.]MTK52630.1 hypothetical protein [Paludibacter sp.]